MRRTLAFVLLTLPLGLAACSGSSGSSAGAEGSAGGASTASAGNRRGGGLQFADQVRLETRPRQAPGDILREILARGGFSRVVKASLGLPPSDFRESGRSGTWAIFRVKAEGDSHRPFRAVWEAELAAGALRDEMHAAGLVAPEGYGVIVQEPGGEEHPYEAWPFGDIAYGQVFTAAEHAPDAVKDIASRADAAGLTNVSVETLQPKDVAVELIGRVTDPSAISTRKQLDALLTAVIPHQAAYEGIYVRIDGPSGVPLFALTRSLRTGHGMSYAAPELGLEPLRGPIRESR